MLNMLNPSFKWTEAKEVNLLQDTNLGDPVTQVVIFYVFWYMYKFRKAEIYIGSSRWYISIMLLWSMLWKLEILTTFFFIEFLIGKTLCVKMMFLNMEYSRK